MKSIVNAKIVTQKEVIEGYVLTFDKDIISLSREAPKDIEIIDAKGLYLSAGFIDIHIHGSNGYDVMDATPKALEEISKSILRTGTTSFLATTMTMSKEQITKALKSVQTFRQQEGARVLGVHLEGPFINPTKHGAQDPKHIQKPDIELIEPFMEIIKMITIAPEVEGGGQFIEYIEKHFPHIVLSIGHSNASYNEAKESLVCGVSHATHLFNAMNPLHHREVGVVGAILEADEVSCDIIADLIHIHPSLFKLLYRVKREQLILITDAMRAGCLRDGISEVGGQKVIVKNGEARLEDGTLAGSVLKLNEALKNFYKHTDISLPELISMVTSIPAKKFGLDVGLLEKGYKADMVLFDKEFNIELVIIEGMIVYSNDFIII